MRRDRFVGWSVLGLVLGTAWAPSRGAGPGAEAVLEEKGLTKSGQVFVIEEEAPVLAKMKEARAAYARYAAAAERQSASERVSARVAELEEQRNQLQEALDELDRQIPQQGNPQAAGFSRPGGNPMMQGTLASPLAARRDQVRAALAEVSREQRALKLQVPQTKDGANSAAAAEKQAETFKAALAELRPMVDAVTKTYTELAADSSVQSALIELKKASAKKLRLGPSDAFLAGAKELDQAERRFFGKSTPAATKSTRKKSRK
jgi:chromosome segregation ATPase